MPRKKKPSKALDLLTYLKEAGRWVTADEIAIAIDASRHRVQTLLSRKYELGEVDKQRAQRKTMYRIHTEEVIEEGEKAGPRMYVNAAMPNGSASWWKQYLGGMGFAR